jgi:hypothetical protein
MADAQEKSKSRKSIEIGTVFLLFIDLASKFRNIVANFTPKPFFQWWSEWSFVMPNEAIQTTGLLGLLAIFAYFARSDWKNRKELSLKPKADMIIPPSCLEIEGVPCDVKQMVNGSGTICQILVHNKSQTISANSVKVELLSMEDSPENKEGLRQVLPLFLNQEPNDEKSINPGAGSPFTIFDAVLRHPKVVVNFQRPGLRDKRWMLFEVEKGYRAKIKVTADNSFTETEFNLKFSESFSACKFTLTKIQP